MGIIVLVSYTQELVQESIQRYHLSCTDSLLFRLILTVIKVEQDSA
jgi:hypothetical protein